MPFICQYELDQRPDVELANLYQESYRFIQGCLGEKYAAPNDTDGLPDAVQYYLIYAAALIHGAADASLTLTVHNLGREARIVGRQIFEYWIRATYYANNPAEAKALLLSSPFTERQLLDELGYSKHLERYKLVEQSCSMVLQNHPGFQVYRGPNLRAIVGEKNDRGVTRFYAFLYRIPSQTIHATGAGWGTVMQEDGISFDSREPNPNIDLSIEIWIILQFLSLMNDHLAIDIGTRVEELEKRLDEVRDRLGDDYGASEF